MYLLQSENVEPAVSEHVAIYIYTFIFIYSFIYYWFSILCCLLHIDGPVVECDTTTADVSQFNVYLRCLVRARPSLTSLFWITDVNGTTVPDDDVTSGGYWSTVMVRGAPSFSTLFMQ